MFFKHALEEGRPATGKEEGIGHKQMHMKLVFDDGSQRIDSGAEVSGLEISLK